MKNCGWKWCGDQDVIVRAREFSRAPIRRITPRAASRIDPIHGVDNTKIIDDLTLELIASHVSDAASHDDSIDTQWERTRQIETYCGRVQAKRNRSACHLSVVGCSQN